MALSGQIKAVVLNEYNAEKWYFYTNWTGVQDIATNTTTITANTYFYAAPGYNVSAGARTATINIGGDSKTISYSLSISGGQTVFLGTTTHTVPHNSDGSKTISNSATYQFRITRTYDGRYYGDYSGSETVTLDTIPRKPILNFSVDNTKPNIINYNLSITNSNTMDKYIWKIGSSGTQTTVINIDTSIINLRIPSLTANTTYTLYIKARTKGLTDELGLSDWQTYTFITNSIPTITSDIANIGVQNNFTISNVNGFTSYSFTVKERNLTSLATLASGSGSVSSNVLTYTPTGTLSTIANYYTNSQYSQIRISCTLSSEYETITITKDLDMSFVYGHENDFKPTFASSNVNYRATDSATLKFSPTGNLCIKDISTMLFTISPATPKYNSTITRYEIINNGVQTTISSGISSTFTYTNQNQSVQQIVIKVIDSREMITEILITISNFVEYQPPAITSSVINRADFVDEYLDIELHGTYTSLNNANRIDYIKYGFVDFDSSNLPTVWTNLDLATISQSNGSFQISVDTTDIDEFDANSSYKLYIKLIDYAEHETISTYYTIPVAKPLIWLDTENDRVGINKKPGQYSLEVDGDIDITGNYKINGNNTVLNVVYLTSEEYSSLTTKIQIQYTL